jgi:hypothetical protein
MLAGIQPGVLDFWRSPQSSLASRESRIPESAALPLFALVMSVFYACWLEKSHSVAAPIIGHDLSDGVEYLLLLIWVGLAT